MRGTIARGKLASIKYARKAVPPGTSTNRISGNGAKGARLIVPTPRIFLQNVRGTEMLMVFFPNVILTAKLS